jgi:hypothetical protein
MSKNFESQILDIQNEINKVRCLLQENDSINPDEKLTPRETQLSDWLQEMEQKFDRAFDSIM